MKAQLRHPHGYNPRLNGSQCSCEGGVIGLVKYYWKELQRELDYQCNRCNKRFLLVCADEHRFFALQADH